MFNNKDFYPTGNDVIETMLQGEAISGKVFLEPSAGKGNIVDYLIDAGAKDVIACESHEELSKILETKCKIIESDFLNLTSDRISHIDYIVMNPPFSADETHILHAYKIAPAGCKIIALCNYSTLSNPYTNSRKQLVSLISNYGTSESLGDCFTEAERKTGVEVGLIRLTKPGQKAKDEFNGFFMEEEPDQPQHEGIMAYNVVRDLVNRYVSACKVYSELLTVKSRLNAITGSFFGGDLGIKASLTYEDYKKQLQVSGWNWILGKMNLTKYTTRGVREDINKFVQQQTQIPFTMKNIYHMLDIVQQTAGQRMDKAIIEVFDRITEHHHDNRYNIKGWKTNSHFLVGKKFILPNQVSPAREYGVTMESYGSLRDSYNGAMPDFEKALCYVEGISYDDINTINHSINRNKYGEWYESHFFKYKGYKNGNMHFEFKNEEIWGRFNQRVAKLKGYPLYEPKAQTAYQQRQTGHAKQEKAAHMKSNKATKPNVLFEFSI